MDGRQQHHTPSLPDARPTSDRPRRGGRESNFLAEIAGRPMADEGRVDRAAGNSRREVRRDGDAIFAAENSGQNNVKFLLSTASVFK